MAPTPFSTSATSTTNAGHLPRVRNTFVAPVALEPCSRISMPLREFPRQIARGRRTEKIGDHQSNRARYPESHGCYFQFHATSVLSPTSFDRYGSIAPVWRTARYCRTAPINGHPACLSRIPGKFQPASARRAMHLFQLAGTAPLKCALLVRTFGFFVRYSCVLLLRSLRSRPCLLR
jgi:hypothetical protein